MMFDSAIVNEPPYKKKKEEEETLLSDLFSSLPDAVILNCLARLSKFELGILSVVSSSYRSLVASPDLHMAKSLRGCTEKHLYVCLRSPPLEPVSVQWFIYRSEKTLNVRKWNRNNRLCQVTSFPSNQPLESSVVSLDCGIYIIGGELNGKLSSGVLHLDCHSHRWKQLPSMAVARVSPVVGVVDGKIYVFGGCDYNDSWGEVFDPKTQTWDTLPLPDIRISHDWICGSIVLDKKVYAMDEYGDIFYYSPSEAKWGIGTHVPNLELSKCCVIDGLLYTCDTDTFGELYWCEVSDFLGEYKEMEWKKVKGLKALKKSVSRDYVENLSTSTKFISENGITRISNYGGNIVVFWDVVVMGIDDDDVEALQIWCAEISLERRDNGKIWGKIEWSDIVKTTDSLLYSSEVLHSVSVDV